MSTARVNGRTCELGTETGSTLLAHLRDELGLTGSKPGCGEGECGACTVLVDGAPVLACRTLLAEVVGRSVTTIEGLIDGAGLHAIQQALIEERASQCGYCTPGIALRAAALLASDPDPDDDRLAAALDPNLCRCGCYPRIVRAVRRAAATSRGSSVRTRPDQPALDEIELPRPRRPWDLTKPRDREWFDALGDGLVVVWPPPVSAPGMWSTGGGAWLHLAPGGTVTAFSGKVDVGQDNRTAFALLVAEELEIDPAQVRVVLGDTDVCPFDMGTFGSRSMPDAGEALRRAAAGAREVLAGLAATRPSDGTGRFVPEAVPGPPARERPDYGHLLAGMRRLEVLSEEPALHTPETWQIAGRPGHTPARLDVVTGARRFVSDLVRPGMLHGAVLRPPVVGSSMRAVDPAPAERLTGTTVVRDGDFVAVAAGSAATARRAVAAIDAEWDVPPPGPVDVVAHLRAHPIAGEGWEGALDEAVGDVDGALDAAATRLEATYTTAYLAHVPLETRAAVAEWEGGRLTVWVGTQVPFGVRAHLADELGLDEADVRVIVPPTGGGFGGKHGEEVALEAARLARGAGRPVKVRWNRVEEFQWGRLRPMAVIDVRAGVDPAGVITAWDFLDINAGTAGIGAPYAIANRRLRYQPAASPVAQSSYRALAATANHFARESLVDELAAAIGADPVAFRLRNLADGRLATVLEAAAERFASPRRRPETVPGEGGSGVAVGLEKGGRVATFTRVRVEADGSPRVTEIVTAYECGAVVNLDTVVNQIEGGTVMALGGALFEEVRLDHGRIAEPCLASYRVPRFSDLPRLEVVLLDRPDIASAGAGETPLVTVAPAIANAIFAATGRRLRSLPLAPGGSRPTVPSP
ncbi:MAG: molybdopterin cofactor-binding domain-containing protein [Acidimicrobiales bacterium]|jgi:isoquinoline 1-oxidoreductase